MVLLILENKAGVRSALVQMLKKHHDVLTCEDGAAAVNLLSSRSIDVVITESGTPEIEGVDLVRRARELSPRTSFVLIAPDQAAEQANVLERLLVLGGPATPDISPKATTSPEMTGDLNATLEALEYRILQETLALHHYNQVKAAEALGITRGALQYKMKKYHLVDEDKEAA